MSDHNWKRPVRIPPVFPSVSVKRCPPHQHHRQQEQKLSSQHTRTNLSSTSSSTQIACPFIPPTLRAIAMASRSSDFILDEGLDDDEDMLAFHVQRKVEPTPKPKQDPPADATPSTTNDIQSTPAPTRDPDPEPESETSTIIIDGLPLQASRADLNSFLPSPETITHIRLRRLESHGLLRVMVEYASPATAADALLLDGSDFQGSALSIKRGSPERWAATAPRRARQPQAGLWSSLGAMAERLEEGARKLGEEIENRLHVSERVAGTASKLKEVDNQYGVSEKVAGMAHAGMETAKGVDRQYGISNGVGRVVGNVNNAAKVVAREVDESFRVGDRAREAANVVMKNETVGPVARALASGGSQSKKNYQPRGEPPEEEQRSNTQEVGGIADDGRIVEAGNKVEVGE